MHRTTARGSLVGAILAVAICGSSHADTVYLKNGSWIDGIVRTRNEDLIQLEIGDIGKIEIPIDEVYEIEKNSRTGSARQVSVEGRKLEVEVRADSENRQRPEPGSQETGKSREVASKSPADSTPPKAAAGSSPTTDSTAEGDEGDDKGEDAAGDAGGSESDPSGPAGGREGEKLDPELRARIEALVRELKGQKSRDRVRAQRHLRAIGPSCLSFLLPLASDASELARVSVFRLFDEFGDDRVIPACIQGLEDTNEYVRDYAHRALRRITREDFGYSPFASPHRRAAAVKKWQKWWTDEQAEIEKLKAGTE